jgi:hypothetical protein
MKDTSWILYPVLGNHLLDGSDHISDVTLAHARINRQRDQTLIGPARVGKSSRLYPYDFR